MRSRHFQITNLIYTLKGGFTLINSVGSGYQGTPPTILAIICRDEDGHFEFHISTTHIS